MTEPAFCLGLFSAALLSASLVAIIRRRRLHRTRPVATPTRTWSLKSVLSLLHQIPFERLSPRHQRSVVEGLLRIDRSPVSMREHGRINLILGEISLSMGDREEAQVRFRAALRWDPSLPIRRTLERLENPSLLGLTSRRAA